jgi:hypothetical protein
MKLASIKYIPPFSPRPSWTYSIFIIFIVVLLTSHPIQGLLGVNVHILFFLASLLLILSGLYRSHGQIDIKPMYVSIILVLLTCVGSFISGVMHQLLIGLAGATMLIAASLTFSIFATKRNIAILIWLNVVILAGAWIGFAYAFYGGYPILEVTAPEIQRPLPLYFSTFTNSIILNVIRPSGIFDEPGALAMFSIMTVCLNELCRGDRAYSISILVLSLITFSLMSLIGILLYVMFMFNNNSTKNFIWLIAVLFILGIGYYFGGDVVQDLYLNRLVLVDGRFAGDNRITQVIDFFDLVDSTIFFSGYDSTNSPYLTVDQSSNPFTLLFSSGFFVWLPYFVVILWLLSFLFKGVAQIRFVALIMALLLLQRPYIFSMFWGFYINYVLFILYRASNDVKGRAKLFTISNIEVSKSVQM